MGRHKSVYTQGEKPVFKYYKNRKTYFSNASRYVTHEEARAIIAECSGDFDVLGIDKEKFLMKILSATSNDIESDVLYRAIKHGGFVSYIKKLEGVAHAAVYAIDKVIDVVPDFELADS